MLDAARRCWRSARAGLPIVMVGDWSAPAGGLSAPRQTRRGRRSSMNSVPLPTTRTVVETLVRHGSRRARHQSRRRARRHRRLMHVHRSRRRRLLLPRERPARGEPTAQPRRATSGSPRPTRRRCPTCSTRGPATSAAAAYERPATDPAAGDLIPGESTMVGLAKPASPEQLPVGATRVVDRAGGGSSAATEAALRVTSAGTYQVPRADGSTATVTVDRVRQPIVPDAWTLELEDWKPADPADPTELGDRQGGAPRRVRRGPVVVDGVRSRGRLRHRQGTAPRCGSWR